MERKITGVVCVLLLLITGCADFSACIKRDPLSPGVVKILIGKFEYRDMSYDPYTVPAFMDALRYEFFKKGIHAEFVIPQEKNAGVECQTIPALISRSGTDILIEGVISTREVGFLTDRICSSSISFIIYNKKGNITGQGIYRDKKPAGDDSFQRSAALKISSVIIDKLNK